ncbi:MAG: bifunctional 4-hydroxy-2-oxoglutarate aldolase/2-dehydro-3-deoxy-phosphogluconate aldolase [Lachnospiraceae bacterium]|nr:bifunctional 4-hydroxy-2-oxoglutarate aldolase/2-dehydro-3-deoxy-phosphogluconate aldolase [Lachnospiraceae bacterium]
MNEILKKLHDIGIVPVIALDDIDHAVPLARALEAGGLGACEVTFRTDAAEEAIRLIAKEVPHMLVGAGTVLTCEQADRAIKAGAKFIVSPGFNPNVTKHVLAKDVCMIPGCETPGEMEQAMELGLDTVKFFPAQQNGGATKLRVLAGPYRNLRWMPTGGVNTSNLAEYMSFDKVLACGGTWMVKKDLIESENWDEITAICKDAVMKMLGINVLPLDTGNDTICVSVYDLDRAIYHLSRMGTSFDETTKVEDSKGSKSIYLSDRLGNLAIQFVRK